MFGLIIAAVCAYLVGSIPSGLILGKSIWGIDLREHGSHNIGATNAWRTIGKAGGILIFLCHQTANFLSADIHKWCQMRQRNTLTTVL